MPDISKITLPSGSTYDIKDTTARTGVDELTTAIGSRSIPVGKNNILLRLAAVEEATAGGVKFIISTSAANTPKDVTWTSGGVTIVGTLEANASETGAFYLVPLDVSETKNVYAEYIAATVSVGVKQWEKIGNTEIDLSDYAQYGDATTTVASTTDSAVSGISVNAHQVTNGSITSTGKFTPQATIAKVTSQPASGTYANITPSGNNAESSVTFSGSTNVYSMTSAGSVTAGSAASFSQGTDTFSANTPTVIDTTKFNGGSYSHTGFAAGSGSFTQGTDNYTPTSYAVSSETLTITAGTFTQGTDTHTHTGATYGTDNFTAASLANGFYTAGSAASFTQGEDSFTANTPTAVTLPGRSAAIAALTTSTTGTAAAQTFTGTNAYLTYTGTEGNVSVTGTSNVSVANHTVTDTGHTHTIPALSGTIDIPNA